MTWLTVIGVSACVGCGAVGLIVLWAMAQEFKH